MSIGDVFEKVGQGAEKGLATAGRVAGAVAEPIGKGLLAAADPDAPQIREEQRQQQYKMEDAAIDAQVQELETQLAMAHKYDTLTYEQLQQYATAISKLYSHPRHAGTLMEKLRKAVYPNGAVSTPGVLATLKDATPAGGTAAADEANAESLWGAREQAMLNEIDERAKMTAQYHKPAGKSPPTPGNQLPADAIGPNGQPISPSDRNAGKSFMEWNGAWYPAPKAKPTYKTIKGHLVLMDPATYLPMRDLGPTEGVKMTSRQTPFMGDDGQMHLLNLTSVTTPQGETIEVEAPTPETGGAPVGDGGESKPPAPAQPAGGAKPKPKGVGAILPKTGAQPVTKPPGGVMGPAIPGSTQWAQSKNPLFKSDVAQYTKAAEDATGKKKMLIQAQGLLNDPNRKTDLELVFSWVRSNVQGAGRMTNTEIIQAANAGSWGVRTKSAIEKADTGKLAPELEQQFLADIRRSYETAQAEADGLRKRVEQPGNTPAPGGGDADVDAIVQALKGEEVTPDEAIAKLKTLPEDKQRAVLMQLSPDERKGILSKLNGLPPDKPSGAKKKWSKKKWAAANPGKDVNAASKQAEAQGREVID